MTQDNLTPRLSDTDALRTQLISKSHITIRYVTKTTPVLHDQFQHSRHGVAISCNRWHLVLRARWRYAGYFKQTKQGSQTKQDANLCVDC